MGFNHPLKPLKALGTLLVLIGVLGAVLGIYVVESLITMFIGFGAILLYLSSTKKDYAGYKEAYYARSGEISAEVDYAREVRPAHKSVPWPFSIFTKKKRSRKPRKPKRRAKPHRKSKHRGKKHTKRR